MANNRLHALHDAGVSIWLDFIDRGILTDGTLARRIREDAVTGETTNPTIFEKALAEGHEYDEQLRSASRELDSLELFELIETHDVRAACDLFRPVYDRTDGEDGFVSIEVSPAAANDAKATIEEAHRLWKAVGRPNVMVKVPGTDEGAKAVRALITDGLNINITLLFAVEAHRRVIEAYRDALEDRVQRGQPVNRIASVASFFVSRVDSEVDKRLDAAAAAGRDAGEAGALKGQAAIANAKLAYQLFTGMFAGPRWERLAEKGARVQRPLWASTSTKNPEYRDVRYVEGLIGPHTVNTMPPATIDAFRDHGEVKRTVDRDVEQANETFERLRRLGIEMNDVTSTLLADGIASFQKSFDGLISGLEKKVAQLGRPSAAAKARV